MAPARKVLVADPDLASVRALTRALRKKGHQVYSVRDGARALELAVLRHPDLVLFDRACPMLEARTFIDILRTNPRTETIPVVVTSGASEADQALREVPGALLHKPYNLDEVLAHIDDLLSRADRRGIEEENQEIEGALSQLGLPDLLQTLAVNRRTGRVALRRGAERGEVDLQDGRPVDARTGVAQGEKALFRLLAWDEGTFSFQPGVLPAQTRISQTIDGLLLEGARQLDETTRLSSMLGGWEARWFPVEGALLRAMSPFARALLERLDEPRTTAELLDLGEEPDLTVLQALSNLAAEGLIRPLDMESPPAPEPLLTAAEAHAVRARLARGRFPARSLVAKVLLAGRDAASAREGLGGLPLLAPEGMSPESLGTVAELELPEGLRVDFCALPAGELAQPLWRPFSGDAAGLLLMDTSAESVALARFLAAQEGGEVAVVGAECPGELRPLGVRSHPTPREAVRAVLLAYAGLSG
jgi:CheY-like chemotaxis protein